MWLARLQPEVRAPAFLLFDNSTRSAIQASNQELLPRFASSRATGEGGGVHIELTLAQTIGPPHLMRKLRNTASCALV